MKPIPHLSDEAKLAPHQITHLVRILGSYRSCGSCHRSNTCGTVATYFSAPFQPRLVSVATLGLPTIFPWPEASEEGGLMAYGPRLVQIYRDIWARQAIKLLRGAKPSELPIEQPTIFELIVNVKTAKALGLTISESFLTRPTK
jgi:hypothetical protein